MNYKDTKLDEPIRIINEYRKENNLTQKDLAEKLEVSLATIKRYEKDNRNIPDSKIEKLFILLNINIEDMKFLENSNSDIFEKLKIIYEERKKIESEKYLFKYIEKYYNIYHQTDETTFIFERKNKEKSQKLYLVNEEDMKELDSKLEEIIEKFFISAQEKRKNRT